ncbi:MAG: PAS domain S-box protein [Desulfobacteraceae bacterium]|nr:PAS domain S-box protein [Desulfobacteraceae bacterium]
MDSSPDCKNSQQQIQRLQEENNALKKQVKNLKDQRDTYRQLIENLNEVLYITDIDATVTYITPNVEKISGYRPDEIIGRCYIDFVCPEDLPNRLDFFEKVASGKGVATEYRYRTKEGGYVWVMSNARGIFQNGEISGIQGMLVDITERKNMEQALQESEQRYRNILESIEDGFYEIDMDHNILFCNQALCRILGCSREELIGMPAKNFMDQKNRKKISRAVMSVNKTGEPWRFIDWELIGKDGSIRHIESSLTLVKDDQATPLKYRGIARDVTERKIAEKEKQRLQARLRHAHQMEAIGTLAGGIAHDFNNILSSVIGYAELTKDHLEKDSLPHQNLARINEAGLRAKDLVRQILTLARPIEEDARPVSLVSMIKEALKMLRSTLPSSIELVENISDNNLMINADPTQLHQMIINLATNAKHAMDSGVGTMTVTIEATRFDNSIQNKNPGLRPGDYAHIAVSDTGAGIPEKHINRIFEPYFTTREKGLGTGLGLSIVHGIVKSHNGYIEAESHVGKGSTFHVYFPLIRGKKPQPGDLKKTSLLGGSECILLVDDELPIVEMEQQSLASLGYTIIARTSSIEALQTFKAEPGKFDLVITDMTMPNMTGDMIAREFKKLRPEMPIILCTGFSEHIEKKNGNPEIDAFLLKPVVRDKMAGTVRKVLDAAKNES